MGERSPKAMQGGRKMLQFQTSLMFQNCLSLCITYTIAISFIHIYTFTYLYGRKHPKTPTQPPASLSIGWWYFRQRPSGGALGGSRWRARSLWRWDDASGPGSVSWHKCMDRLFVILCLQTRKMMFTICDKQKYVYESLTVYSLWVKIESPWKSSDFQLRSLPFKMLILVGLPGSGKSSLAARLAAKGYDVVNQDTLGDRNSVKFGSTHHRFYSFLHIVEISAMLHQ